MELRSSLMVFYISVCLGTESPPCEHQVESFGSGHFVSLLVVFLVLAVGFLMMTAACARERRKARITAKKLEDELSKAGRNSVDDVEDPYEIENPMYVSCKARQQQQVGQRNVETTDVEEDYELENPLYVPLEVRQELQDVGQKNVETTSVTEDYELENPLYVPLEVRQEQQDVGQRNIETTNVEEDYELENPLYVTLEVRLQQQNGAVQYSRN